MKQDLSKRGALTAVVIASLSSVGSAAIWTNSAGTNNFGDSGNWSTGVVPNSTSENVDISLSADDAAILSSGSYTVRAIQVGIGSGNAGTFNVTGGSINADATAADRVGVGGGTGTFNQSGGTVRLAGAGVDFGLDINSVGTYNLSGGSLVLGRAMTGDTYSLRLGQNGTGTLNITGGAFTSRTGVFNGATATGSGTFRVVGTGATTIGIGSESSLDGYYRQSATGRLELGLTSAGITPILVDETDGTPGTGNDGNALFDAGAVLAPFDAGGTPTNTWFTVLTAEGTLTNNGIVLDATSLANGWDFRVQGNSLQVQLVPEPATLGLLAMSPLLLRRRR